MYTNNDNKKYYIYVTNSLLFGKNKNILMQQIDLNNYQINAYFYDNLSYDIVEKSIKFKYDNNDKHNTLNDNDIVTIMHSKYILKYTTGLWERFTVNVSVSPAPAVNTSASPVANNNRAFGELCQFKTKEEIVVIEQPVGGKHLRVDPQNNNLGNSQGGQGGWAQWMIYPYNNGTARFKSTKTNKFLRITKNKQIKTNGGTGKLWTSFNVHRDGAVTKLESNALPGSYLAVTPNGQSLRIGSGGKWCAFKIYTKGNNNDNDNDNDNDNNNDNDNDAGYNDFPNVQCSITIKTAHGKYVCAENADRQFAVNANRDNAFIWEIFTSIPAGNGRVNLKTHHGKYLCAEKKDNTLIGNRDNAGPWEKFAVEKHGNQYAFKSAHGKYVCAENQKKGFVVVANRGKVGSWERFTVNVSAKASVYSQPDIGNDDNDNKDDKDNEYVFNHENINKFSIPLNNNNINKYKLYNLYVSFVAGYLFKYVSDFDMNGVFYGIGSEFGKQDYKNPLIHNKIKMHIHTQGKWGMDFKPIRSFQFRSKSHCKLKETIVATGYGQLDSRPYFTINLLKYKLIATHYTLRHGYSTFYGCLMSWNFEGSVDGKKWIAIKKHSDDHSLKGDDYKSCTYKVDTKEYYQYFRIYMTRREYCNTDTRWHLYCSGIELYGRLVDSNAKNKAFFFKQFIP